ncbi:hypothetical protein F4825DRAFT_311129 [Nemania diffusa]|nr:hypothetical protein F4825DRAFT_311129 [Nemania diffusa]
MPRKVRLPADTAQNRENQQRSRARRREYVAGLEARVREFESREVRASLEMQRAAREVAWVNERLVELLVARGVTRGEVDEFLRRRREQEEEGEHGTVAGRSTRGADVGSGSRRGCLNGVSRAVSVGDAGTERSEGGEREGVENRGENTNEQKRVCGSGTNGRIAHVDADMGVGMGIGVDTLGLAVNGEEINVCDGVSETPRRLANAAEGARALVTSCDDAASIIAGFQGHGDVSHARKALGCGDATNCHVKNTRLFQLMDETGRP